MKKKKRALTLLEIMIVIALITLITGVIGYNMRGTLDRGRAFRTEQAKEQLHDMLLLCLAEGKKPREILQHTEECITELGFAKKPKELLKDGWGKNFSIKFLEEVSDFEVTSSEHDKYLAKRDTKTR